MIHAVGFVWDPAGMGAQIMPSNKAFMACPDVDGARCLARRIFFIIYLARDTDAHKCCASYAYGAMHISEGNVCNRVLEKHLFHGTSTADPHGHRVGRVETNTSGKAHALM